VKLSGISEKKNIKTLRTSYWGDYFVKHFGVIRDKLYKKRFGYIYPFPENMGVPVEGGIHTHDNGRIAVTVVDNPNVEKISIREAIRRVQKMLDSGYR